MTGIIIHGDARELPLPDKAVSAVICDPPYALEFMGKKWDGWETPAAFQSWCATWASEAFRVLKPGGWLVAFGGSRTWHRLTCAIEDTGFEIRDSIAWLYGSGFPKSLNVSRAIDQHRAAGDERDAIRAWLNTKRMAAGMSLADVNAALDAATNGGGLASAWMTNPTSKGFPSWEQWQTLKALLAFDDEKDDEVRRLHEIAAGSDRPVIGTATDTASTRKVRILAGRERYDITTSATAAAAEWDGWGTALKPSFEPTVVARKPLAGTVAANVLAYGTGALNIAATRNGDRWPANVVMDPTIADALDEQAGMRVSGATPTRRGSDKVRNAYGEFKGQEECEPVRGANRGGASRFFPVFRYEAKAPDAERPTVDGISHETVKPLDLMRWLVRLVTPPDGLILDPFAGSGTTIEAAMLEGFDVIGIEQDAQYLPLIRHRIARAERRRQPGIARLAGSKPPVVAAGQADLFADLGTAS